MKTVLVFRSAALGDFVMTSPALWEIRKCFPNHHVLLLTIQAANRSQSKKVEKYVGHCKSLPWIEMVKPHLVDEVVTLNSVTNVSYMLSVRQYLKGYQIDTVIVMSDIWSPWVSRCMKWVLMRFLVGSVRMLGWRGARNAIGLKRKGLLKHHVHGPLQFLSEMIPPRKYRDEDLIFDLRPGQAAIDWISDWLREKSLSNGVRLIAVAPGSIQSHKRWPMQSFETLIRSILDRYDDTHIVVIGTPTDNALGSALVTVAPERIHNLAGVASIAQSAALLQQCDLLVGNDGGAMHLGDAMGCKVVSIVPGIEYPDSIEPWHNKSLAVRHSVDCSPCYNFIECPKGHNRCMTELPLEKVLAVCISVLDQK